MCECAHWGDMEHGEGIFAFVHSSCRENDADEMDTCVSKEWKGRGLCQKLDIDGGDITDDVASIIRDC